ncbi:hypothetical protein T439DRAFT_369184 [Meredithblackwellia eburnea MCA 4105]
MVLLVFLALVTLLFVAFLLFRPASQPVSQPASHNQSEYNYYCHLTYHTNKNLESEEFLIHLNQQQPTSTNSIPASVDVEASCQWHHLLSFLVHPRTTQFLSAGHIVKRIAQFASEILSNQQPHDSEHISQVTTDFDRVSFSSQHSSSTGSSSCPSVTSQSSIASVPSYHSPNSTSTSTSTSAPQLETSLISPISGGAATITPASSGVIGTTSTRPTLTPGGRYRTPLERAFAPSPPISALVSPRASSPANLDHGPILETTVAMKDLQNRHQNYEDHDTYGFAVIEGAHPASSSSQASYSHNFATPVHLSYPHPSPPSQQQQQPTPTTYSMQYQHTQPITSNYHIPVSHPAPIDQAHNYHPFALAGSCAPSLQNMPITGSGYPSFTPSASYPQHPQPLQAQAQEGMRPHPSRRMSQSSHRAVQPYPNPNSRPASLHSVSSSSSSISSSSFSSVLSVGEDIDTPGLGGAGRERPSSISSVSSLNNLTLACRPPSVASIASSASASASGPPSRSRPPSIQNISQLASLPVTGVGRLGSTAAALELSSSTMALQEQQLQQRILEQQLEKRPLRPLNSRDEYYTWNTETGQLFRVPPGTIVDEEEVRRKGGELIHFPPGTCHQGRSRTSPIRRETPFRVAERPIFLPNIVKDMIADGVILAASPTVAFAFRQRGQLPFESRLTLPHDPIKRMCELYTESMRCNRNATKTGDRSTSRDRSNRRSSGDSESGWNSEGGSRSSTSMPDDAEQDLDEDEDEYVVEPAVHAGMPDVVAVPLQQRRMSQSSNFSSNSSDFGYTSTTFGVLPPALGPSQPSVSNSQHSHLESFDMDSLSRMHEQGIVGMGNERHEHAEEFAAGVSSIHPIAMEEDSVSRELALSMMSHPAQDQATPVQDGSSSGHTWLASYGFVVPGAVLPDEPPVPIFPTAPAGHGGASSFLFFDED